MDECQIIYYSIKMSYFLKEFGKKIKGYRELRGYSQERLGELVDVSTKTVVFWENGKSFIEYPKLVRLCEALEIEEVQLFDFKPQKGDSCLDQAAAIISKLSPAKQKQILSIIKTFED